MKRVMAIVLFMMVTTSIFGQQFLSPQGEFYHKSITLKWNIGFTNDDIYILVGVFKYTVKDNILKLNDRLSIKTEDGDFSIVVTEDIFSQKNNDGYLKFPLSLSDIKRMAKGVISIILIHEDEDHNIKFREYDYGMMSKEAKHILKMKEKKQVDIHQQTSKKNYPSWRDEM